MTEVIDTTQWKRPFSTKERVVIKSLRFSHKPAEIAQIIKEMFPPGRSVGSIYQLLHRETQKGCQFPKLRHGKLKYDKQKAQELRDLVRKGFKYKHIHQEIGIHPAIISRLFAAEIRGELKW